MYIKNGEYLIDENNNKIHKTCILYDNIIIGKNNIFKPYCVIGESGFIRGEDNIDGKVVIGDGNVFGAYTSIMVGKEGKTIIGNNNLIMNYCNIGHNSTIGNNNEIGANSIICGHVYIGDNNKIKVGVNIRNRIKIGDNNLIGMSSNIVSDIISNKKIWGNPGKEIGENQTNKT